MAIDSAGQIVVRHLVHYSANIARDKTVAGRHVTATALIGSIQSASGHCVAEPAEGPAVDIKTHLYGHTDRRHGVAFMTGSTAHALRNSMQLMRSGTSRVGRIGRRRIVYQTGGITIVGIVGNRRVAVTGVATGPEPFRVTVARDAVIQVLVRKPTGVIGGIVIVKLVLAMTTFADFVRIGMTGGSITSRVIVTKIGASVNGTGEGDRIDSGLIREFINCSRVN